MDTVPCLERSPSMVECEVRYVAWPIRPAQAEDTLRSYDTPYLGLSSNAQSCFVLVPGRIPESPAIAGA